MMQFEILNSSKRLVKVTFLLDSDDLNRVSKSVVRFVNPSVLRGLELILAKYNEVFFGTILECTALCFCNINDIKEMM